MRNSWQVTTEFPNQRPITHMLMADTLSLGSFPTNEFRLPPHCPKHLLAIEEGGATLKITTQDKNAKVQVKKNRAEITWKDLKITIELKEDRSTEITSKLEAKKDKAPSVQNAWVLWHIFQGRLLESYPLQPRDPMEKHRLPVSGFSFSFDSFSKKLVFYKPSGDFQSLTLENHGSSLRVASGEHVYLLTPQDDKKIFEALPVDQSLLNAFGRDHFWPALILVLGFWFCFVGYLQRDMSEVELADMMEETLKPEDKKITVEKKKKEKAGGERGGGGVESAKASDPRGGSGYQDEVLVQDRNVLASAPGVLAAFANLDKSMKASGNNTGAGIFGGQNRAQGILKALGGMMGSGGGGTGVGGVGTKGFGGGGGGGVGTGYGKGSGAGVGNGEGGNSLAFEEGGLSIMGGLEKSEINAVVDENFAQIRYCYNKGLRNNPSLKGKVVSKFVITGEGKVSVSKVGSSTLLNPGVENCISARISTWTFPKPRGGGQVTVNYPFILNKS
jgi:hypothetical protein